MSRSKATWEETEVAPAAWALAVGLGESASRQAPTTYRHTRGWTMSPGIHRSHRPRSARAAVGVSWAKAQETQALCVLGFVRPRSQARTICRQAPPLLFVVSWLICA